MKKNCYRLPKLKYRKYNIENLNPLAQLSYLNKKVVLWALTFGLYGQTHRHLYQNAHLTFFILNHIQRVFLQI